MENGAFTFVLSGHCSSRTKQPDCLRCCECVCPPEGKRSSGLGVSCAKIPAWSSSLGVSCTKIPAWSSSLGVSCTRIPAWSNSLRVSCTKIPAWSSGLGVSCVKSPAWSSGLGVSCAKIPRGIPWRCFKSPTSSLLRRIS